MDAGVGVDGVDNLAGTGVHDERRELGSLSDARADHETYGENRPARHGSDHQLPSGAARANLESGKRYEAIALFSVNLARGFRVENPFASGGGETALNRQL